MRIWLLLPLLLALGSFSTYISMLTSIPVIIINIHKQMLMALSMQCIPTLSTGLSWFSPSHVDSRILCRMLDDIEWCFCGCICGGGSSSSEGQSLCFRLDMLLFLGAASLICSKHGSQCCWVAIPRANFPLWTHWYCHFTRRCSNSPWHGVMVSNESSSLEYIVTYHPCSKPISGAKQLNCLSVVAESVYLVCRQIKYLLDPLLLCLRWILSSFGGIIMVHFCSCGCCSTSSGCLLWW